MRLTSFSDYALRILLFIASTPDRLVTIAELRDMYGLSEGHLMKVVRLLSGEGFLEAVRGRNGGLRLGRSADEISIGVVVRKTEPDFRLVECFAEENNCLIAEHCRLPGPLNDALNAFFTTLDNYTLADMMVSKQHYVRSAKTSYPRRGPIIRPPPTA